MNICKDCTKWRADRSGHMGACSAHRAVGCGTGQVLLATHAMDGCNTQFVSIARAEVTRIDAVLNSLEACFSAPSVGLE